MRMCEAPILSPSVGRETTQFTELQNAVDCTPPPPISHPKTTYDKCCCTKRRKQLLTYFLHETPGDPGPGRPDYSPRSGHLAKILSSGSLVARLGRASLKCFPRVFFKTLIAPDTVRKYICFPSYVLRNMWSFYFRTPYRVCKRDGLIKCRSVCVHETAHCSQGIFILSRLLGISAQGDDI